VIISCHSAGRSENVLTLQEQWPEKWKSSTYLVVPEKEYKDYKGVWPQIEVHPNLDRCSPIHDWVNNHFGNYDPHVIHADDDSKFSDRFTGAVTAERMNQELDWFAEQLKTGYIYLGMGFRWMSQDRKEIVEWPPGISNFYGVNTVALKSLNFQFSDVVLLQGLHLAICVAKSEYKSRMLYRTVYHQPVVNAPGGCSRYRTGEMYDSTVQEFKNIHGKYISSRKREVKWRGMEGARDIIRIAWRRILKDYPAKKLWRPPGTRFEMEPVELKTKGFDFAAFLDGKEEIT